MFRFRCCRQAGHSKFSFLLFGKQPGIARPLSDAQEPGLKDINFPIPLDKDSALDFVSKFTRNVPLLLKFIDPIDTICTLSLGDDVDQTPTCFPVDKEPHALIYPVVGGCLDGSVGDVDFT